MCLFKPARLEEDKTPFGSVWLLLEIIIRIISGLKVNIFRRLGLEIFWILYKFS